MDKKEIDHILNLFDAVERAIIIFGRKYPKTQGYLEEHVRKPFDTAFVKMAEVKMDEDD